MKITFVGTSHGAPWADRHCTCFMIESGNSVYFVDGGAPMVEAIQKAGKRVEDLRAVFVTHIHSDHTVGLIQLTGLINWFYAKAAADFFIPEQVHIDATKNWLFAVRDGAVDEKRIRFKIPTAGVMYKDENIKAEFIPTSHGACEHSYAILITEGEKKVLFGGDLSGQLKRNDLPEMLKTDETELFVSELSHYGLEHLEPHMKDFCTKRVAFTHVYPLSRYEEIEQIKDKYHFEILAPNDGDVLEI